jgi:hypothetical protein
MTMKALAVLPFSLLVGLGSVVDASAQRSTTEGWVFGLDFGGAAVSFDHNDSDTGPLVDGRLGYGLNSVVTVYMDAYEADIVVDKFDAFDNVTFGHIDYGVRLHLPNGRRRWVPYADLAVFTFWPVSDVLENGEQTTTDFSAVPSSSLGAGLAIYLSAAWALDVNVRLGTGHFADVEVGNVAASETTEHVHRFVDIDAESARLTVGVSWWPQ